MPASPTPAQADASRRNGALSQGPVTPEGRAASAGNAARHGLRSAGPPRLLPDEDAAAYAALRDALSTRHNPADAAEVHCVEELAFAYWRQRRLRALEIAALDAADPVAEPDGDTPAARHPPPSPATAPGSSATFAWPRPSWPASRRCARACRATSPALARSSSAT